MYYYLSIRGLLYTESGIKALEEYDRNKKIESIMQNLTEEANIESCLRSWFGGEGFETQRRIAVCYLFGVILIVLVYSILIFMILYKLYLVYLI